MNTNNSSNLYRVQITQSFYPFAQITQSIFLLPNCSNPNIEFKGSEGMCDHFYSIFLSLCANYSIYRTPRTLFRSPFTNGQRKLLHYYKKTSPEHTEWNTSAHWGQERRQSEGYLLGSCYQSCTLFHSPHKLKYSRFVLTYHRHRSSFCIWQEINLHSIQRASS